VGQDEDVHSLIGALEKPEIRAAYDRRQRTAHQGLMGFMACCRLR
jgi:hypothetical protein